MNSSEIPDLMARIGAAVGEHLDDELILAVKENQPDTWYVGRSEDVGKLWGEAMLNGGGVVVQIDGRRYRLVPDELRDIYSLLLPDERAEFEKWAAEQKALALQIYEFSPLAPYCETGSDFVWTIQPGKIGCIINVRYIPTQQVLDLSHPENW